MGIVNFLGHFHKISSLGSYCFLRLQPYNKVVVLFYFMRLFTVGYHLLSFLGESSVLFCNFDECTIFNTIDLIKLFNGVERLSFN